MESTQPIGNKCISKIEKDQLSITVIPHMIYESLSKDYGIGAEFFNNGNGHTTRYRELKCERKREKVFLLYTSRKKGEATETKLALLTCEPSKDSFESGYEFEIRCFLQGGSWTYGTGNLYGEVLSYATKDSRAVKVNHAMTEYVMHALKLAFELANNPKMIMRKFNDYSPTPDKF